MIFNDHDQSVIPSLLSFAVNTTGWTPKLAIGNVLDETSWMK